MTKGAEGGGGDRRVHHEWQGQDRECKIAGANAGHFRWGAQSGEQRHGKVRSSQAQPQRQDESQGLSDPYGSRDAHRITRTVGT